MIGNSEACLTIATLTASLARCCSLPSEDDASRYVVVSAAVCDVRKSRGGSEFPGRKFTRDTFDRPARPRDLNLGRAACRKRRLLKYVHETRARLMRLLAVLKWTSEISSAVNCQVVCPFRFGDSVII